MHTQGQVSSGCTPKETAVGWLSCSQLPVIHCDMSAVQVDRCCWSALTWDGWYDHRSVCHQCTHEDEVDAFWLAAAGLLLYAVTHAPFHAPVLRPTSWPNARAAAGLFCSISDAHLRPAEVNIRNRIRLLTELDGFRISHAQALN